jgi:hypothetical protein
MRILRFAAALLLLASVLFGAEEYRVYTEHPRLWLDARRLRLLRREQDRKSIRWQHLQALREAGEAFPEEPLVLALEYQVTGSEDSARRAAAWALERSGRAETPDPAELRLLAIVFDWCYAVISEQDRRTLAQRMARGVAAAAGQPGWPAFAGRVLAGIALADDWEESEAALTNAFEEAWRKKLLPDLERGRGLETPADRVALLEFCHASRDNLNLDPWDQARRFFRQFPVYLLLQYYPRPVSVEGQRFHQPSAPLGQKLDPVRQGELGRLAELLTSAYETNSVETQFLQGWLTHDTYRLQRPSGAPYEFLWMNPYQPGLSYYSAPLVLHDEVGGTLLARSSWDDDAAWIGYFGGELQLFADGERIRLGPSGKPEPVVFPDAAVVWVSGDAAFQVRMGERPDLYLVGLQPDRTYWVKAGEGDFLPKTAGRGGILTLYAEPGATTSFELRTTEPPPPPPPAEPPKRRRR